MGAIYFARIFAINFFQDCELAFRWIFCPSSIYRYKDLVKMCFYKNFSHKPSASSLCLYNVYVLSVAFDYKAIFHL